MMRPHRFEQPFWNRRQSFMMWMECFDKVKKMADKVKMIEKHLDIVSQTHLKMRDLQEKIIELDEWRSTNKDIPNSLPSVKSMTL